MPIHRYVSDLQEQSVAEKTLSYGVLISVTGHLSLAEEHSFADGCDYAEGQGKRLRHCWRPNASHKGTD